MWIWEEIDFSMKDLCKLSLKCEALKYCCMQVLDLMVDSWADYLFVAALVCLQGLFSFHLPLKIGCNQRNPWTHFKLHFPVGHVAALIYVTVILNSVSHVCRYLTHNGLLCPISSLIWVLSYDLLIDNSSVPAVNLELLWPEQNALGEDIDISVSLLTVLSSVGTVMI